MMEPDPEPQVEATAMINGSGPTKDSGIEAVPSNKPGAEKKDREEVKDMQDDNSVEEMKNGEGRHAVKETEDVKEENCAMNEDHVKENKSREEAKEGPEKNDAEGMNGTEKTQKKEEKHVIREMNGVEETKEGEEKNSGSGRNIDDEKDTKKVEEIAAAEENNNVEKMKDQVETNNMEENRELGENEDTVVKNDVVGKMDTEKKVEEKEEGKGKKRTDDVEMAEAEEVKEEVRMETDERVEDDGVKLGEKADIKEKLAIGNAEAGDDKKVAMLKKKRSRSGRKSGGKGESKDKKDGEEEVGVATEKKDGIKKVMEPLSSPTPLSIERPVRERKIVERLVEVIETEPIKGVVIEKGCGTPLMDIPNVAYNLAKKKPADLRLLHQTLFGRKGKAADFKNHILQFSGFAGHESDEKQRAKVKEKLEKCVKDYLLDLCDLLDISVSKANARKDDLILKLLDFMAAPHATTDVLLAEQQSPKSRKRKMVARGSASKGTEDAVLKQSRKKRVKIEHAQSSKENNATDTEDDDEQEEDEDNKREGHSEDEELGHSDSEKEKKYKEANEKDEDKDDKDDEDSGKGKQSMKKSSKEHNSLKKEKVKTESSSKKTPPVTTAKSPEKTPSSTHSKSDVKSDVGYKVFVRKKKNVDPPKKKSTSKPDVKEKSSGKRSTGDKSKSEAAGQSNPSMDELRGTTCEILKKVDFNTATFTDILKKLATHYKVDLTPRKAAIQQMVQEELTRLADEAAESEEDVQDSEKEEHPAPRGKKVDA